VPVMNNSEIDRAVREVVKRTVSDADLRLLAIEDGNAAITSVSGKPLPDELKVRFVDNYGKAIRTIVLPDPAFEIEHLRETDLEAVAGGMVAPCGATCGFVSCLST
jgi:hypothetical protein